MKTILLAGLAALTLGCTAAHADGKIFVQLPDLTAYNGVEAEQFLTRVVMANVVSSNCAGYEITEEDWSLLTDSADLLAYGQLKLSVDAYDDGYYKPAFDAVDQPGTCDEFGPDVEKVLAELVGHGGGREPLPDQAKAYEEWRALMDRIETEAKDASTTKVKTKS